MIKYYGTRGFTLLEMILVITITGIIAGVVVLFLRVPVMQYTDISRRAELADIADTALRRITRDLRSALPNSVVRTGTCNGTAICTLEFIPTTGGGRYRIGVGNTNNFLDFTATDTNFEVLGPMPTLSAGDEIVIYNLGIDGASAYAGANRSAYDAANTAAPILAITAIQFPFDSPGRRFHVIQSPVRYVCNPAQGTITRLSAYGWAGNTATATTAILAKNVTSCLFTYDTNVVAQRSGLVTMSLTLSDSGEAVTLYSATHVSNQP